MSINSESTADVGKKSIKVISDIDQDTFANTYIANRMPVIVRGIPYSENNWSPEGIKQHIGHLQALLYGSLFDLEEILSAADYIDEYFNAPGPAVDGIPYVRWYSQLKDVDFPWGDEAFELMAEHWTKPECFPSQNLTVPVTTAGTTHDPVTDRFPYRGLLIAARGARTRLHRDPFCTDAVVCQFHGRKEAALYHPDRQGELMQQDDQTSFGGFRDLRESNLDTLEVEPDFHGILEPGDMIYIPHGWLHDVIAIEDSISVTWNFIHQQSDSALKSYLSEAPETDSEYEVLQYFFSEAGFKDLSPAALLKYID